MVKRLKGWHTERSGYAAVGGGGDPCIEEVRIDE
jgi:hypothetical protein